MIMKNDLIGFFWERVSKAADTVVGLSDADGKKQYAS